MSGKKNIENLFNDALGKAGTRPPKGTQEDIKKKLIESGYLKDNNSSKRTLFWLMGITGLALLSVTALYFLNDKNKNLSQTTTQSQQNNNAIATKEKQLSNESTRDNFPGRAGSPAMETESSTELDSINQGNPGSKRNFNSDTNSGSGIFSKQAEEEKEETSLNEKGKNSTGDGKKAQAVRHNRGKDNSPAENNFKSKSADNGNPGRISDENAKEDFVAEKNQQTEETQKPEAKPLEGPLDSAAVNDSSGIEGPQKQNTAAENDSTQNIDSLSVRENKKEVQPDSLSKIKNKKRFSIDLFAAPQISAFKVSGDASYKSLTDVFEISETEKISFSAGIGLNIPYKNFFVEPGVNYSLVKSDFSYSKPQMVWDTSGSHYNYNIYFSYILDSSGIPIDSFLVKDSSWVTVANLSYSKISVKTSNKISILEIPLWAGYKFSAGKFDMEVKTGASVSFITSIHTTLLPANSETVILYNDREDSPYRKNYFSLLAAANVVYNINDRFSIFLQPAFKYGLGSIFKKDYPVSKKIQNYSLGAGLRIKF
ncbi:MAG TPA: hypothetical protein VJY62_03020 [Bacteroidia bacterium]|nr:hypothetical protein [Bacteroidia bacterium]